MKTNEMKRGDTVGQYVGTMGIAWICWEAHLYDAMCEAFDAMAR